MFFEPLKLNKIGETFKASFKEEQPNATNAAFIAVSGGEYVLDRE